MSKALLLCLCLAVLACGGKESAEKQPAPAAQQEPGEATDIPAPVINNEGETQVMDAEDLQKLGEDQKDAIQRDSPLGEEKDPLADLQEQLGNKKK